MNRERVIIDMDEVIADPMGEMIRWYKEKHDGEINHGKMLGGSWVKGFPEEHHDMIHERLLSPGFFRNLPVMQDAVDVIREMNQRYELFIVSAAMEFPDSLKDKVEWLGDNFPFLTWKQITLCGDKRLIYGDHMIDDHVKNLEHFKGKPWLFTSAHNLDITAYNRIENWKHAAEVFLK
jgi:5'(3')-deoxyribonucleotidase